MALTIAAKNIMLDAIGASSVFASLHSAPPTDAGINEVSGGAPAYARKAIAWDAAASGQMNKDASDPIFDIPAGTDVHYVGLWSAVTGGTFYGYSPLSGGGVSGNACVHAASDQLESVAHGLNDGDKITVASVFGQALPSGLLADTLYFVVGAGADDFQVSLTLGGVPIDITVSGELRFQKVINQMYNIQGTLKADTYLLDMIV